MSKKVLKNEKKKIPIIENRSEKVNMKNISQKYGSMENNRTDNTNLLAHKLIFHKGNPIIFIIGEFFDPFHQNLFHSLS